MYFLSIFTGLEFASVVITPDAWYHPTQTFFLTTLINKEYRVILHSGTSKVECLMQAAACIFVSQRINELPINKFWSMGGGAWSVAAVAMLIGLVLPRFGGRQTSDQGGMTQLSDG